jgi:hypothetical protein
MLGLVPTLALIRGRDSRAHVELSGGAVEERLAEATEVRGLADPHGARVGGDDRAGRPRSRG